MVKKMRKKILLIILFLLLIHPALSYTTQNLISKADEFRIDLLRYNPSPVEPGETTDVWFSITNTNDKDLENFKISLVDPFPFSLEPETTITINKLKPGDKETFKFRLKTNKDIQDSSYNLHLQYYSDKIEKETSEAFTITVRRVNRIVSTTDVSIDKIPLEKKKIAPGETFKLTIDIENFADYIMKDLTLNLDLGIAPFSPLKTTLEKKIKQINPNEIIPVNFELIALPDASPNVYKLSLNTTYYDELGNKYEKDDTLGLIISSEPKIHVEIKKNEIYNKKGTGEITLNFVNTGLTKLKFLKIQLNEHKEKLKIFKIPLWNYQPYEILSEDNIYLGDIDPDDDESAEFRLKLNSKTNKILLPLTLTFMDASNEEYTQEKTLGLEIHNKKDMGVKQGSNLWIIILIVILTLFYLRYRSWKKRTKQKGILIYLKSLLTKFSFKK